MEQRTGSEPQTREELERSREEARLKVLGSMTRSMRERALTLFGWAVELEVVARGGFIQLDFPEGATSGERAADADFLRAYFFHYLLR